MDYNLSKWRYIHFYYSLGTGGSQPYTYYTCSSITLYGFSLTSVSNRNAHGESNWTERETHWGRQGWRGECCLIHTSAHIHTLYGCRQSLPHNTHSDAGWDWRETYQIHTESFLTHKHTHTNTPSLLHWRWNNWIATRPRTHDQLRASEQLLSLRIWTHALIFSRSHETRWRYFPVSVLSVTRRSCGLYEGGWILRTECVKWAHVSNKWMHEFARSSQTPGLKHKQGVDWYPTNLPIDWSVYDRDQ